MVLESAPKNPPGTISAEAVNEMFLETGEVLAELAEPLNVQWALARDGQPLGHDPQADDLCADWRPGRRRDDRRCPSRSAASATGTTATPGFATLRSRSTRCSALGIRRRRLPSCSG